MIYSFNLQEKLVLITGGYGYLGKAITESLLYHGATVHVLGRDRNKFLQAFGNNPGLDETLFFQYCDIENSNSISGAFQAVYDRAKKIDVLINNAFYSKGQSPESMSDEEWAVGIDGTLNSIFRCIKEIIPYFKERGKGKIINVSSMYGLVAPDFDVYENSPQFLNPPHYGAAKAGLIQMTKYYASYLGQYGINVNSVTPGPFPSMEVQKNHDFMGELRKRTCLKRIGKPEDVAGAFVFLSSDSSNFITGENIVIDGGWTIK